MYSKKYRIFIWITVTMILTWVLLGCASEPPAPNTNPESNPSVNVHGTPFALNGVLHVTDGKLMNQHDQPIQLRGMSSHGLQWYSECIRDSSLQLLAVNWGADFLRLAMYVQEDGYLSKPAYFRELVDGYVGKLLQRGMYAIIDWHQLSPGDPNYNLDAAKEYFTYMSAKHGDKGNVIYEICNEPSGVEWSDIYEYAEKIIPVIRANDPDSVIVVGTPNWSSNPSAVIGNELPFDNIMYTIHFYAAAHGKDVRDDAGKAADAGLALFATEFGTQGYTGDGKNDFESSNAWIKLLAERGISWSNWNFSDDGFSGAVWLDGTCIGERWWDKNLKESGHWIKDKLSNPKDSWDI